MEKFSKGIEKSKRIIIRIWLLLDVLVAHKYINKKQRPYIFDHKSLFQLIEKLNEQVKEDGQKEFLHQLRFFFTILSYILNNA